MIARGLLFPVFFLFLFSSAYSQEKSTKRQEPFKVVGYYFLNAALKDTVYNDAAYPFLDKITHLNIAFINPDSTGTFSKGLAIDTLIKKAHQKGVKVLASIAGGGSHAYYSALLQQPKREKLVTDLTALALQYNLDGIDVDLEGGDIDENYEPFVIELGASLKGAKKLMTAAIATSYKNQLTDKALQQFDFINVMSYDATGPWRPQDAGPHAPYAMAVTDLDYWHQVRGLPKEKLNLGLPFYGYGFHPDKITTISMNYNEIAAVNGGNQTADSVTLNGSTVVYFNSTATIKNKTLLALKNGGGVMIWQLLGDAQGEGSLLNAIHNTVLKERKK